MNLSELKKAVAETAELSQDAAEAVIKAVMASITESLKSDDAVVITGFGTFSVASRSARKGRNPKTGLEIQIAASKVVRFKPGKILKEAVAS
ncbi:MAG: HU family DNA-binding protein [Nitrospirae bacterium]|nr:HU family DNA-binding protein [Magnetococcales bacterium]HAT49068.1 integration host factor subunit alpha [Alphaproteobacteria bacterium]